VAGSEAAPDLQWQQELEAWLSGPQPAETEGLKKTLQRFVPEYAPQL
jgi:hypothetical protein